MLQLSTVIKIAALLSYIALALLTARSRSAPSVRRFFNIYLFIMIYWQFVSLMLNFSKTPGMAIFWYNLQAPGAALYSVLFFPFTRAFLGIKKQKYLAYLAYAISAVLLIISILGSISIKVVYMGRGGIYVPEMPSLVYVLGIIGYSFWGMGLYNLIRELLHSNSSFQRNRIMYLLAGSV